MGKEIRPIDLERLGEVAYWIDGFVTAIIFLDEHYDITPSNLHEGHVDSLLDIQQHLQGYQHPKNRERGDDGI